MTREEEREAIKLSIESIKKTTGSRPLGLYCREMSTNTRELVVEEGGFLYDSDCYSDDLPYWTKVHGKTHLVVPYTLVTNDARYILGTGYGSPDDFFLQAKACLDRLRNDGDDCGRMMSIGLHPRITPTASHASSNTPRSTRTWSSCAASTSPRASPSRCRNPFESGSAAGVSLTRTRSCY
jgi:peptidoglycan/xylan/chitin deacetylase (PgdA/CDA1 family)